jgi:hypothetical protein
VIKALAAEPLKILSGLPCGVSLGQQAGHEFDQSAVADAATWRLKSSSAANRAMTCGSQGTGLGVGSPGVVDARIKSANVTTSGAGRAVAA